MVLSQVAHKLLDEGSVSSSETFPQLRAYHVLVRTDNQGSCTFSKYKFKYFSSTFKVHFQTFPALLLHTFTTVVYYIFAYILTLNQMLLCYFKCHSICDDILQKSDKLKENMFHGLDCIIYATLYAEKFIVDCS